MDSSDAPTAPVSGKLDDLLDFMCGRGGSDLHLLSGDPPRVRRYGELVTLSEHEMSRGEVRDIVLGIMPQRHLEVFKKQDQCDFTMVRANGERYRVNVFRHLGGVGATLRAIPRVPEDLQGLGLPATVATLCMQRQGLILMTGKTGSGKTTTLAGMVNYLNHHIRGHILTIEDPIEYVHERRKCLISQREIGEHAAGFASALRSALREDPDVILVGEMRDLETISLAVTAAETGILVMGTLHTSGATSTVDRIINTFPVEKQSHVRTMLSTSLCGVISQQLIPRVDGEGMVPAVEIMINTPAVGHAIREGKIDQLENMIQAGGLMGMQSNDNALRRLLDQQLISIEAAYEAATVKTQFEV